MTGRWDIQKQQVVETARRMATMGLVSGTSGNVSVRLGSYAGRDLMAITASGVSYDTLGADDIAIVDYEMEPVEGEAIPSSESLLHVAIYRRRPDVDAVVHTHALYSSVAAVAGVDIPPIVDEMVVTLGGAIGVSEYAFPGSSELAENVCDALGDRSAALIRSHGSVGVGHSLEEALDACALTEKVAQIFVMSSMLGKVTELPADVVEAETAIYRMRRGKA
jgi:L-fuculose-phosphate aldolase